MKSAQIAIVIILIVRLCNHIRKDCKKQTEKEVSIAMAASVMVFFIDLWLLDCAGALSELIK